MYNSRYDSQAGFQDFFASHEDVGDIESQFSDIGLPFPEWANDPEWQELASMGIGPIEAVQLVSPELSETSAENIESMLREQAWEMRPEEQAEFWKRLKKKALKFARKAIRFVKPLAKAGGTAVGTFFGGPAGAAIGAKIGGALGGIATRGLTQLTQKGGARKLRQQINTGINTARTRVNNGQPVFNNQQVGSALSRLQQLLANPQIAALLGRRESYYGDNFSEELSEETLYEVVGEILDVADSLEAALDYSPRSESAPQYYDAAAEQYPLARLSGSLRG